MNKKERLVFITSKLDELFPSPPIPLNHQDAYTLLIAVLLSAQCTDKRVNQVTDILFKKANSPKKMIELGEAQITEIIKPCGFFKTKGRHIFSLSEILLEKYSGEVPQTFYNLFQSVLYQLPIIFSSLFFMSSQPLSHIFKIPAFPVDTHIHRLAKRWQLSDGESVEKTERDLKKIFPESAWEKLHLQIIYFGRTYCKARGHIISDCPICSVIGCKE